MPSSSNPSSSVSTSGSALGSTAGSTAGFTAGSTTAPTTGPGETAVASPTGPGSVLARALQRIPPGGRVVVVGSATAGAAPVDPGLVDPATTILAVARDERRGAGTSDPVDLVVVAPGGTWWTRTVSVARWSRRVVPGGWLVVDSGGDAAAFAPTSVTAAIVVRPRRWHLDRGGDGQLALRRTVQRVPDAALFLARLARHAVTGHSG